jgi:hypothetical protein
MIELQNLLIIILILYMLNSMKINKKTQNKFIKNKSTNKKETFVQLNKYNKNTYEFDKKSQNRIYGQIQYDVIDYDNQDVKYKFQDFDIIQKDKELELSKNVNSLNKYNDLTKINNKFDSSQNKFIKNTITDLPCQQDIIYDTKFNQPSDADFYNPNDLSQINYKERKIQDVYNEIVNGNSANNKNKKYVQELSQFNSGASGLKSYRNIDWEYEGDNDGMSYDPRSSTLSAF